MNGSATMLLVHICCNLAKYKTTIYSEAISTPMSKKSTLFADARNVSRTMVAYNAQCSGLIDAREYREFSQYFREQWRQQRERERERERNRSTENGPNYYVVQRHRIGASMLNLAKRMMGAGALSTSKAAKILGIKPKQVHRMLETTL